MNLTIAVTRTKINYSSLWLKDKFQSARTNRPQPKELTNEGLEEKIASVTSKDPDRLLYSHSTELTDSSSAWIWEVARVPQDSCPVYLVGYETWLGSHKGSCPVLYWGDAWRFEYRRMIAVGPCLRRQATLGPVRHRPSISKLVLRLRYWTFFLLMVHLRSSTNNWKTFRD